VTEDIKFFAQAFGEEGLAQKPSKRYWPIKSTGKVWSKIFFLRNPGAVFVLKSSNLSYQQIGIFSM